MKPRTLYIVLGPVLAYLGFALGPETFSSVFTATSLLAQRILWASTLGACGIGVAAISRRLMRNRSTGNLVLLCREHHNEGAYRGRIQPPINAQFLFYLLLDPQNCDALVGDLEERYRLIYKRFGRRRANFWYWTQTVVSLGPFVWAWGKQKALKPVVALIGWAVAKGLIGHDGWLAALVELLKRVRS